MRRLIAGVLMVVTTGLILPFSVSAAPLHPNVAKKLRAADGGLPHAVSFLRAPKSDPRVPSKAPTPPSPAPTGTWNILVILIMYGDTAATLPDGDGDEPAGNFSSLLMSMNDYYTEVSGGKFSTAGGAGLVSGWHTASRVKSLYTSIVASAYPNNVARLVEEAVDAAEAAGVDFSPYDNDGDGAVDGLIIVHAGQGFEATGDATDPSSLQWDIASAGGTPRAYDGVTVNKFVLAPEWGITPGTLSTIGVFCHEFGHNLGLPDLYDTDYSSSGVGVFCLMGGGMWLGGASNDGSRPAHLSAWPKTFLQWLTPTNITTNGLYDVSQVETSASACRLWTNGQTGSEYFLVENRQKTGFDADLPGSGLLVWHIDETQDTNDNETRKLVDLEEADGLGELDSGIHPGDAGDFFPGTAANTGFSDQSAPSALACSGAATNVMVLAIPASAAVMNVEFRVKNDPTAPPAPPSSLKATTVSDTGISLSWADNALDEDGFIIERGPDGSSFMEAARVGPNVKTYADTGLTPSTIYHYRVRAWNAAGFSAWTAAANATTAPAAPMFLGASIISDTQAILSWKDVSSDETGFRIERGTDGTTFAEIATAGAGVTTYTDTLTATTTPYYYRVRAYSAAGNSAYSNTASTYADGTNPHSGGCFLAGIRR
ncbi:MAG: M6 family metalloprotease domain-containing protein [Planctomycetota bacterium]